MKIIHLTKGNRGLSQVERGEMIGDSMERNNQGDAILACDFAPLPLFSSTPSHMWLSSLENPVVTQFELRLDFKWISSPLKEKNSFWMNLCRKIIKEDSVILLGMRKHGQQRAV